MGRGSREGLPMMLTYLALLVLVGASLPAVVRSFLPPLPRRITGITP